VLAPDVNVLVYAHRAESPDHDRYAAWVKQLAAGPEPFGLSDSVSAAFVRIVTNPRLWDPPTAPLDALEFMIRLRRRRACRLLFPGPACWEIFAGLVEAASARGKLVADAWLAAQVMEHACTLATCDADFARFPDLRWLHPLQPER
jgi:toxin-antitoxin system PIN domain toxin